MKLKNALFVCDYGLQLVTLVIMWQWPAMFSTSCRRFVSSFIIFVFVFLVMCTRQRKRRVDECCGYRARIIDIHRYLTLIIGEVLVANSNSQVALQIWCQMFWLAGWKLKLNLIIMVTWSKLSNQKYLCGCPPCGVDGTPFWKRTARCMVFTVPQKFEFGVYFCTNVGKRLWIWKTGCIWKLFAQ